jgi:SAM-dependent methyltransferase
MSFLAYTIRAPSAAAFCAILRLPVCFTASGEVYVPARSELVSYEEKLEQEQGIYAHVQDVHGLPEIFHYWSNRYLRPHLEVRGFSSPDEMFLCYAGLAAREALAGSPLRILSLGAGNGDLELSILNRLPAAEAQVTHIDCLELNPRMIERGQVAAAAAGFSHSISFIQTDFNTWRHSGAPYRLIFANQSLHHVLALEHLLGQVHTALSLDGRFIISDMIGRNGHRRWPEALEAIWDFWSELPLSYRRNRQLGTYEELYVDRDFSRVGFEGIRAQDILPLLCERFGFAWFHAFGNIIDPFVDRSFGPNFDVTRDWDRDLIDRVHAADEAGIARGAWTPTHLLAVLRKEPDPSTAPAHLIRRGPLRNPQPPPQRYRGFGAQELPALLQTLQELSASLDREREHAQSLHLESRERVRWALSLERDLAVARQEYERLHQESERIAQWGATLDRENTELAAALSKLQSEFAERTAWALQLDQEIESSRVRHAALASELSALSWARRLSDEWPRLASLFQRIFPA